MQNNIITFPGSRHMESYITIKPKLIAADFEYVRNTLDTKFLLAEVAFIDVQTGELIFSSLVNPEGEFKISKRMKERGFSREDFDSAPTFSQIDRLIKYLLMGCDLLGWNIVSDLRNYPQLKVYANKTICGMRRYSERHGPYDYYFNQHTYVRLGDTALERGFELEEGEMFHVAAVDARACAYLWNWLNKEEQPAPSSSDLILRAEVENYLQELSSLTSKKKKEEEEAEDADVIPF